MYAFWDVPFVALIFVLHFVTAVVPYFILLLFGLKKVSSNYLYAVTRFYSYLVLKSLGVTLHISKDPEAEKLIKNHERICFVSNHTSLLDTPSIIFATRANLGFVVKNTLAYVPFLNLATFAMKCVFIERTNIKNSIAGIQRGVKKIAKGHSMLIFPEGTRSKTGNIAAFKPGALRLASESDSYVIPIAIKGVRQACEGRKKFFGRYEGYISLGAPIKMNKEDSREARFEKIEKIEEIIRKSCDFLGEKNVL